MAKITNLFDLNSFDNLKNGAISGGYHSFADSVGGGILLQRQLQYVNPNIFTKEFPDLSLLNTGITVDNTGGYANSVLSLRSMPVGSFELKNNYSDNRGKISTAVESKEIKIVQLEAHAIWTDSELKTCETMGNINIANRELANMNEIYLREVETISLAGYTYGTDINGNSIKKFITNENLVDNSYFPTTTSAKAVEDMTGEEMYNAISNLIISQRSAINNTRSYSANVVIMPIRVLNKLQATWFSINASSSITINNVLSALQFIYPDVTFVGSAFIGDTAETSRIVAFSNRPQAMVIRMPVPLLVSPIINWTGHRYRVDAYYRIGGVDIFDKTAGRILVGM